VDIVVNAPLDAKAPAPTSPESPRIPQNPPESPRIFKDIPEIPSQVGAPWKILMEIPMLFNANCALETRFEYS